MITRHEIKNPQMAVASRVRQYESLVKGISGIVSDPTLLGLARNNFHQNAAVAITAGLAKAEIIKDLQYTSIFGMSLWKIAGRLVEEITLPIEGIPHRISLQSITEYNSVSNWSTAVDLAVVLRQKDDLQTLCEAAAVVFGENFSNADDQIASVGRFYLSIVRGDLGVSHKIILELVSRDPKIELPKGENGALLFHPRYRLWQSILENNEQEAEALLKIALESHKQFWGTEEHRQNKFGWISLPLLAACAYAYDHGLDLNVESDYIPRWLVTGDFS